MDDAGIEVKSNIGVRQLAVGCLPFISPRTLTHVAGFCRVPVDIFIGRAPACAAVGGCRSASGGLSALILTRIAPPGSPPLRAPG